MKIIGITLLVLTLAIAMMNIRVIVQESLRGLNNTKPKQCDNPDCKCDDVKNCKQ